MVGREGKVQLNQTELSISLPIFITCINPNRIGHFLYVQEGLAGGGRPIEEEKICIDPAGSKHTLKNSERMATFRRL